MDEKNKQIRILQFIAINRFMLPEYRLEVIQTVFSQTAGLSGERRKSLIQAFRKNITIPGFRDSWLAPLPIRIKNAVMAFEKNSNFVGIVLSSWVDLHADLAQQIYALLQERDWELLPPDADRSKLPGFLTNWRKAETYEILDEAYKMKFPDAPFNENDNRLMVVWLANRLPFEMEE